MAFIDIDYLTGLGYRIPQSSLDNVQDQLNTLIENIEKEYLQNTLGYDLTAQLYALVTPYPPEVEIFLNGNEVDGPSYYKGVLNEIASLIMGNFYGTISISVNNSGFTEPKSDGEYMVAPNFVVSDLVAATHNARVYTYYWLQDNNTGFFDTWLSDYFNDLKRLSVW